MLHKVGMCSTKTEMENIICKEINKLFFYFKSSRLWLKRAHYSLKQTAVAWVPQQQHSTRNQGTGIERGCGSLILQLVIL